MEDWTSLGESGGPLLYESSCGFGHPALFNAMVNPRKDDAVRALRASFVRDYFVYLENVGTIAAVLHGWEGDFEGRISDVDYVIDKASFERLPEIVDSYCRRSGWRLCQILRHETTAAFCVCSSITDPSLVVALDACSDYRRNGTLLLGAKELLEDRVSLPWGGFRLSDPMELNYRFVKAAAKRKSVEEIGAELGAYSQEAKAACEDWLRTRWNVVMKDWSPLEMRRGLESLFKRTRNPMGFLKGASLARIADRINRPSGLIVVCGEGVDESVLGRLHEVFKELYFRRSVRLGNSGWGGVVLTIKSTFITVPRLSGLIRRVLGQAVVFDLSQVEVEDSVLAVAEHLHRRCLEREGISA